MLFYHSSKSSAYSRVRSEGSCFLDRASGVGGLFACRGRTVYGENEKRLCVRRCESACRVTWRVCSVKGVVDSVKREP